MVKLRRSKSKRKTPEQASSAIATHHTAVDVHTPLTGEGIVQLQSTIGNTAVQRLINDGGVSTIQRFGVGELWDTVADAGSSAWNFLKNMGQDTKTSPGKPASTDHYVLPEGAFTITDANAIIRRPPPDLSSEKGKPTIPQGAQVKIVAATSKGGKFYVQVQAEGQETWTAASNIEGLPAKLAELNPKRDEPEDVVVPRPSSGGTFGLPAKPDLKNAEFDAIVQEMEQMEQNPVAVEKKHGEETGDDRGKRVEKIASLRERITALAGTLSAAEAKQVQAYLYRRLAPLSPYYNQIGNTNLLGSDKVTSKSDQDAGWYRTCNVTVPAMVLEGIGKTKDDYIHQEKLPLLRKTFDALEGNYKQRAAYEDATDFDDLRMPDFMAVIAIARKLPDNAESLSETDFAKKVADARKAAAKATTAHSTMMWLLDQFGASHDNHSVHSSELEAIGGAQRDYTKAILRGKNPEQWRELYNRVQANPSEFESLSKEDKKRYQTLWKYEQLNQEKADEKLSVSTYRDAVLKKVNPLLDKGAQILVGMEEHFIRLDALDETGIQVDDPGEKGFKNLRVTWEQARNLGYFKVFWSVTN